MEDGYECPSYGPAAIEGSLEVTTASGASGPKYDGKKGARRVYRRHSEWRYVMHGIQQEYLANTYIYLPPLSISPIALIPSVNLRLCFSHIGLIPSGFVANILEVGKRGLVRFSTSPSADLLAEMAWNEGGNERKGLLQVISRRLWTARKMATMSASLIIASTIDIERTIRSFVVV